MKSLLSYKQENNSKYKDILHNSVIVFVHTFIFGPINVLGEDETYVYSYTDTYNLFSNCLRKPQHTLGAYPRNP